jgi:hypothetical protein
MATLPSSGLLPKRGGDVLIATVNHFGKATRTSAPRALPQLLAPFLAACCQTQRAIGRAEPNQSRAQRHQSHQRPPTLVVRTRGHHGQAHHDANDPIHSSEICLHRFSNAATLTQRPASGHPRTTRIKPFVGIATAPEVSFAPDLHHERIPLKRNPSNLLRNFRAACRTCEVRRPVVAG